MPEKDQGELINLRVIVGRTAEACGVPPVTVLCCCCTAQSCGRLYRYPAQAEKPMGKAKVGRPKIEVDEFLWCHMLCCAFFFFCLGKQPTLDNALASCSGRDRGPAKPGTNVILVVNEVDGFSVPVNQGDRKIMMEKPDIAEWRYRYFCKT